uniref:Uncharacterized protein n=1 Tax=Arundo donax TaxID=35708 RepID=A0A0A9BYJ9_ARUDO
MNSNISKFQSVHVSNTHIIVMNNFTITMILNFLATSTSFCSRLTLL